MNYKNMSKLAAQLILAAPARAFDGETSIAAVVDSLEGVPEALHAFYVEKDGKFQLQVSGAAPSPDVARLTEALRKERNDHNQLKDRVKLLGERRIEDVVTDLDRIPELEAAAAGNLDEDKINGIVEGRIRSRLAPVERERDGLKGQIADKDKTIGEFQAKERTRTIHDKVREEAVKAKLLPEAVDDALLLADRIMEVEEGTGRVVTKDNVGVTPGIEPSVWLTDVQKTRPHWWGPSQGGGAGGNRGGGGDATQNPFTHDNWNLTKQGDLVRQDRAKADQMAKAAGTTVGGPRPAAPAK